MADYSPTQTITKTTEAPKPSLSSSSILFHSNKVTTFAYAFSFACIVFTAILLFFNPSGYSFPFELFRGNPTFSGKNDESLQPHLNGDDDNHQMGIAPSPNPIVFLSNQTSNNNHTNTNTSIQVSGKVGFSGKLEGSEKKNESFSSNGVLEGKGEAGRSSHVALKSKESGDDDGLDFLRNECDLFDGKWVRVDDDTYPLYAPGTCPYIDESFNCFLNKRPDNGYGKYRWQPSHCNLPRLDGRNMLGLLRGKRLVFVGDSLNRNMWESMVCLLRNSVDDKSRVVEASGRSEFRTEGSYSFIFKDYNCTVEFVRSPFLVQEWETPDANGSLKETLRLDLIERSSDKYKSADVLIFNTGHWWTHEKTSRGKGYYQEGSHIYDELNVKEAFRKALMTWARWVDTNINPEKTIVFFRGYSPNHFRGGRWNSGGQCHGVTEPLAKEANRGKYAAKLRIMDSVITGMMTPLIYLNISRMTDFRRDAHPSIYRKQKFTEEERKLPFRYEDCSHWCLPGVPDTWNELLYAQLIKHNQKQQNSSVKNRSGGNRR